jgi:hypothetical protein
VMGFVDDDKLTGQAAECSVEKIHLRRQPEWGDGAAEWIMSENLEREILKRGADLKL